MGTDLTVIVVGPEPRAEELANRSLTRVAELEACWSRFQPDSEVSRLNGAVGAPLTVSDDTVELVRRAVEAWRISGTLVDCTQLTALIEAGYDRSFEQLTADTPARQSPAPAFSLRDLFGGDPGDIEINGHTVTLPLGVGFDPGGIGKGLAADLVTAELLAAGAQGACVNLGGDLRVRGTGPGGGNWTVAIEHPYQAEPLIVVGLADGAVASSTTLRRRWQVDGEGRHHLIDPRTGQPSETAHTFACAVADSGWRAETMAKTLLLTAAPDPFALLNEPGSRPGVEGLVVDNTGAVTSSPGFTRFTGGVAPGPFLSAPTRSFPNPLAETRS
jgi:FAD:protein FMN transferase